ncbi:hypothetical protein EELLY_v1c05940 [Entomoplasma ellychniae]|uniref:Uncharacterized protein n=1 Tax=Entomoplasma ellychniae TaxID=2114 RepID=A0A8E2UEA9_9MOLU|nr:hypothetical protein EELLY_v1c05940 [Entomoplasma ellychniae]
MKKGISILGSSWISLLLNLTIIDFFWMIFLIFNFEQFHSMFFISLFVSIIYLVVLSAYIILFILHNQKKITLKWIKFLFPSKVPQKTKNLGWLNFLNWIWSFLLLSLGILFFALFKEGATVLLGLSFIYFFFGALAFVCPILVFLFYYSNNNLQKYNVYFALFGLGFSSIYGFYELLNHRSYSENAVNNIQNNTKGISVIGSIWIGFVANVLIASPFQIVAGILENKNWLFILGICSLVLSCLYLILFILTKKNIIHKHFINFFVPQQKSRVKHDLFYLLLINIIYLVSFLITFILSVFLKQNWSWESNMIWFYFNVVIIIMSVISSSCILLIWYQYDQWIPYIKYIALFNPFFGIIYGIYEIYNHNIDNDGEIKL